MKLQQLRYFREVCMRNSVTKAADALFVAQPTVSNAIRDLEREFGLKLFKRSQGKLTLTKEGSYLLMASQHLLQQAEEIEERMHSFGSEQNVIRVSLPPMIGLSIFDLVRDFKKVAPNLIIRHRDMTSLEARKMLDQDQLDVLIVSGFNTDFENCSTFHLGTRELHFCVHQDHPLAQEKLVTVAQIADQPLVMFPKDFYVSRIITEHFQQAGLIPNACGEFYQLTSHLRAIKSQGMCSFLFLDALQNQPDIVGIPFDPPMRVNLEMVWRKNSWKQKSVRQFIEFAKHYVSENMV